MKDRTKRLPRVLLIYEELIPSIRLCGHMQMEYLASVKKIEYRTCTTRSTLFQNLDWPDIVILGRLDSWQNYNWALEFKRKGKYIIYILDDDLLNIPETLSSAHHYRSVRVQKSIQALIEMSDAILSPSPDLLEKYAKNKRAILTEEPAVKPVDYRPNTNGIVTIGFAGSIDRTEDFESILKNTCELISEEYGTRVKFAFFGAIPSFASELNAEVIPYTKSYDDYREQMNRAKWDIGLAPMPNTPFHKYKHYNKFIEYAAAGVAGVYSECGPYKRLKEEIGIGVFCNNESESWYFAIKELIDDSQKREKIRKCANDYAKNELCIEKISEKLYKDNEKIFSYRVPSGFGSIFRSVFSRAARIVKHIIKKVLKRMPGFRILVNYFTETNRLSDYIEDLEWRVNQLSEENLKLRKDYDMIMESLYKYNDQ